jgi:hypothetical protein
MRLPVMKDVAMALGGRDVSRSAIKHALSHSKRSIALVPGGVAEMRSTRSIPDGNVVCGALPPVASQQQNNVGSGGESGVDGCGVGVGVGVCGGNDDKHDNTDDDGVVNTESARDNEIVLVGYHKGFVRLAIQQGVPLVPLFCFGESQLFDNVSLPLLQSAFLRTVGYAYPYWPYGRWGLPVPRRATLTLAVGEPLPVTQCDRPTQQQVDAVHGEYYSAVTTLFETNKERCGYGHARLRLVRERPSH